MRKTWYVITAVLLVLGLAVFFVPQNSIDAAPSTSPVGGGSSDTYSSGGMYLRLDGIKGESTDKSHPDDIDLLSFQQAASRLASFAGGGGAGKANIKDIVITKRVDKASPKLYEAVVKGTHIKDGYIYFVKNNQTGTTATYYKIKLTDIIVTSFTQSGTTEPGSRPVEEITLNFAKIELIYRETKADGTLGPETKTTYDVKLGK